MPTLAHVPAPATPAASTRDRLGYGLPDQTAYDALSRDGVTLRLRPVTAGDRDALLHLVASLSPRSSYQRFMTASRTTAAEYVSELYDPTRTQDAVVAAWQGVLVGVASSHAISQETAEVALLVDDAHQGRGLGTLLLEDLVARSRARGVTTLAAWLLRNNLQMLDVFTHCGLPMSTEAEGESVAVTMALGRPEDLEAAVGQRQRASAVRSLAPLLRPRSVVVVGAGAQRDGVGHQVLDHLKRGEFRGSLYAVNRGGRPVAGVGAYRSVKELPRSVDLAVIAVPAEAVLDVARDCAGQRIGALAVLSAGFGESADGLQAEAELRRICREAGMRLLGPDSIGLVNTDRSVSLNASFLPRTPARGPVAVVSQSGAVAAGLVAMLAEHDLGVSSLVTIGDSTDIGTADLLAFAAEDKGTQVTIAYLESLEDPRGLVRMMEVAGSKPLVLLKAGRSPGASAAARSHTASAADDDAAVDALCRRAGVLRVGSITELVDTAVLLAHQKPPGGHRTVVVGNSGGPGVLALDACAEFGLLAPDLTQHTVMRLRSLLPPTASIGSLVDATASATLGQLRTALTTLAEDPGVDAIVTVVTPLGHLPAGAVRTMLDELSTEHPDVTVVASTADHSAGRGRHVPATDDPRDAVRALARVADWAVARGERLTGVGTPAAASPLVPAPAPAHIPRPGFLAATAGTSAATVLESRQLPPAPAPVKGLAAGVAGAARRVIEDFLVVSPEGGWLTPQEVRSLLRSYGVELVPSIDAVDPETAAEAAQMLPFPVVLKATGPTLVHKSERGGLSLGLRTPDEVHQAARTMLDHLGDALRGFLVQPQVIGRRELIVGGVRLPRWGALVMVGRGGVDTEVDPDRSWGMAPVPEAEACGMLSSLRCAGALSGARGQSAADPHSLTHLVRQVSLLVDQLPEVAELDINPVIVGARRPMPVDARIRVSPSEREPWEGPLRRLRG